MIIDLDRSDPTPIYIKIKQWMQDQIKHGIWPENFKLISETDLAVEMGVSRGTVRQAISELIKEGLLVRIHGRGTFVASKRLEQPLAEHLLAFSEDLIEKGIPFETQVLQKKVIPAPPDITALLDLSQEEQVFFLKRIRRVARTPLILLDNYVVYKYCPGIEKIDFSKYRLFEVLEAKYNLKLDWGKRTFQAQVADANIAQFLEITPCDPVMNLKQIVFLDGNSPIEVSDVWLRGDRFRLSAIVKRKRGESRSIITSEYS